MFAKLSQKPTSNLNLSNNDIVALSTTSYAYDKNYSGADMGDNPTVNLATGRLRYVLPDLSIGEGSYKISVSHIYNSMANSALSSQSTCVGRGWKLNLQQYLVQDGTDSDGNLIYKFVDEMGEIHKFVQYASNKYYDERNARYVLQDNSHSKTIGDNISDTVQFDQYNRIQGKISHRNSAIKKVYEYDEQGRITCVHDIRATKNHIDFEYGDNGLLYAMTAYLDNKKAYGLTYSYTNDMLTQVDKVSFNNNSEVGISLNIWRFDSA